MVRAKTFGNKLSQYTMPPLPDTFPLPPLPPIPVKRLREIALTHTSYYGITRETHDLDTARYLQINDYEKLEFLGDRILGLCVDLMIHEAFPGMRQGVASMMHDQLVRNDLLAQLSDKYGLMERLRTSPSAQYAVKMQTKVRGSVFESYIAGVFYAHLEGEDDEESEKAVVSDAKAPELVAVGSDAELMGVLGMVTGTTSDEVEQNTQQRDTTPQDALTNKDKASTVKPSDGPSKDSTSSSGGITSTPASLPSTLTPISPMYRPQRTYGDALDHTYKWLRPLFRPILDYALQSTQAYQKQLEADEEVAEQKEEVQKAKKEELVAGGASSALNVYCQHTFGTLPAYTCERDSDDPHAWKVICTVTTPDGEIL